MFNQAPTPEADIPAGFHRNPRGIELALKVCNIIRCSRVCQKIWPSKRPNFGHKKVTHLLCFIVEGGLMMIVFEEVNDLYVNIDSWQGIMTDI